MLPSLGNTACHSSSCQQHAGSWAHRHRVRRRLGFPRAWHRAPFFTVQVHSRTLTRPHPCLPPMLSSTPDLISSVSCLGPQLSRPQTGLSFLSCVLQLGKRCTGPRVPPSPRWDPGDRFGLLPAPCPGNQYPIQSDVPSDSKPRLLRHPCCHLPTGATIIFPQVTASVGPLASGLAPLPGRLSPHSIQTDFARTSI